MSEGEDGGEVGGLHVNRGCGAGRPCGGGALRHHLVPSLFPFRAFLRVLPSGLP